MSRKPSRNHAAAFKAQVAIEAMADGDTIAAIAQKQHVHPHQVTQGRRQFIEHAEWVFGASPVAKAPYVDLKGGGLQARRAGPGEPVFGRRAQQGRTAERKTIIDRGYRLAVKRQAELLEISRGSLYQQRAAIPGDQLALIRRIDQAHAGMGAAYPGCCSKA